MLGTRFSRQVSSDFIDWITKDTVRGLMYYWAELDVFITRLIWHVCKTEMIFYVGTVNEWRSNVSILKIISYLYCHWQTFPASFKPTIYHPRFLRVFLVPLAPAQACLARSSSGPREEGEGVFKKILYREPLPQVPTPCPFTVYFNKWNPYPLIYLKPEKASLSGGASPYRPL